MYTKKLKLCHDIYQSIGNDECDARKNDERHKQTKKPAAVTKMLLLNSYLGQISVVIGIRQIQCVRLVVGQNPRKHRVLIKITETSTCHNKSQL